MSFCRVIFDPPASGLWNMAVDEALLDQAPVSDLPTLRFYRWCEPTLSLGYFQRYEDRHLHAASTDLPTVRRSTGGGALIHDKELTYSLVLPPEDQRSRDTVALTCLVHRALIDATQEVLENDLSLSTCGQAINEQSPAEPFLCFQRRSPGDLLAAEEHKVCGSAQRRRRGALLQHGGLIFARSESAPELAGLQDSFSSELGLTDPEFQQRLMECWTKKILESLGFEAKHEELDKPTKLRAEKYAADRENDLSWLKRR